MSFSRAFKYPFRNSPKVISIVLVMTIAFVFCIALVVNSADWSPYLETAYSGNAFTNDHPQQAPGAGLWLGIPGILAIVIIGGFWTNGYSVAAVGEVMNGNDTLPAIEFGKNLRQGFWLFLSSLAYFLLNALLWTALAFAWAIAGSLGDLFSILGLIAALAALFLFTIPSGWAYFIGMARYANQGDRGSLFDIGGNMRVAYKNVSGGARLVLAFVGLTVIYGIFRSIVDGLLGGFAGTDIVVAAALSVSIYYVFNLFQHFSAQHLIAQFALAVDGGQSPPDDIEYGGKYK